MKKTYLTLLLLAALLLSLAACLPEAAPPASQPSLNSSCTHADTDNNTYCDHCGGYVLVEIDIIAVNDLHGKFNDSDSQPGVDELSTYLTSQGSNTLLLASGDIWQGSSESNLTEGKLLTDWMNSLGFAAMTLGNHEFDWGESYIEPNRQLADFPFLAINIYDRETNAPVSYCQPSVTVERGGVTIGIIGAIGDCYSSIASDKREDFYFKTGSELTQLVKDEATRLRHAGADFIIYSLHDGYDRDLSGDRSLTEGQMGGYYDTELSNGYVDLVFEGHTHKHYTFTDEYGVYHMQGGGENEGISHAELTINAANGTVSSVEAAYIRSSTYDNYAPHAGIAQLLEKYKDQISTGEHIVGRNDLFRDGDTLRQLVAQLYYEAGEERWGGKYDLVLGGGFISIRNPWELLAGDVRYGDLYSLFPFDNQLVLCQVRGEILRRNFLETDNGNYYIHLEDYGQTVWENLDPNATYYIVTDTYSSGYAPNQLTVVETYDPGVYARDLLADYIAAGRMEISREVLLTDIPTLLNICKNLAPGATSAESYYVKGTVISVTNTTYGNMTIEDENGNQLYIYGVYDATGQNRYDRMVSPPQLGDTVILWGQLQHYVPASGEAVMEMYHAKVITEKD